MSSQRELRIMFYNSLYPGRTGSFHRTFGLAKLASGAFGKTTIFALDEKREYRGISDGVHLVQGKKYSSFLDKYHFYLQSLLSKHYSLRCPQEALDRMRDDTVLQIEGPYYYNLLKTSGVKNYVLDEANVYWELLDFPAYDIKNRVYNSMSYGRNKAIEIAAIKEASHVLVCSDRDKEKLLSKVPDAADRVSVVPNCVDYDDYASYRTAGEVGGQAADVRKVLFVGAFNYPPNIDAVHVICEKIAPAFGREVRFVITGKNPPEARKPDNVEFRGYVDDLKGLILDCDVCIAPLRYGSGTRFKILEYMAMGKPVVATSKGAEGIEYSDGADIIIEDDFNRFSERIRELLHNPGCLGRNAQRLVTRKYDWKLYKSQLQSIYANISKVS